MKKDIFGIYSNSANEVLKVNFPKNSGRVNLDIYTIEGRKVHFEKFDNHSVKVKNIDITRWSKGVYFVEVKSNKGFQKIKFVAI